MGLRRPPVIICIICCIALSVCRLSESSRERRQDLNPYQPPFPATQSNHYYPPISSGKASEPAALHATTHLQTSNGLQVSGDSHSKAISHVPIQAINKAPASEIQSKSSSPAAKEKESAKDEYVVYYYYYYDNDTAPNANLSFDDIPSLESYDEDKIAKEKNSLSHGNSVPVIAAGNRLNSDISSQARSASGNDMNSVISPDKIHKHFDDILVPIPKPISNVFRYGVNEVPKYPVLPNFIVADTTTVGKPTDVGTPVPASAAQATTPSTAQLSNNEEDASFNNVLDSALESKSLDDKSGTEDFATTTVRAETSTPSIETTTITPTERASRRRPPVANGRRRFNASPSSFSSTRTRAPAASSTTTATTSTSAPPPTKRTFQSNNRVRSRPPVGGSRGRSKTTESNNIIPSSSEATTASSSTARSRFTSSSRRFQSSRSRLSTSTPRPPSSSSSSSASPSVRSRITSRRPNSNLLSRSRPARPGFPRSRPGSEMEVPETTTPAAEETSASSEEEVAPPMTSEIEEEEEESVEPTTTEASRFSALFKPRNRNALGNRPRPVAGNRPPRS